MINSNQNFSEISKRDFNYIFLKKLFDSFGSEEIFNEFGQVVCNVETPLFKVKKNLKFRDLVKSEAITVEKKNKFCFKIQELKNEHGKLFAEIKKTRIPFFTSKITFVNNKGKKQYVAVGDFKNWNYKITNVSNNEILARISIPRMKNLLIKNRKLNLNNFYCLKFVNKNIEKIKVISFVICINEFLHNLQGITNIAGFERRVARMRPFGPDNSLN